MRLQVYRRNAPLHHAISQVMQPWQRLLPAERGPIWKRRARPEYLGGASGARPGDGIQV